MSKDVDRDQVLKNIKVRTLLKNDASWIQKSTQRKEEQDKARAESAAETRPAPVKNKSYVISAAQKFESVASTDSPVNHPLKKTQFTPSEGDSPKQGNVKALAEELSKNVEAQQIKYDPTAAKNKKTNANAVTPLVQSNVERSKAKVSEDAHVKDPTAEISAIAGAEKSKDPTEVPDLNAVHLKPKDKTSAVTEPENATNLDHASIKSMAQPAKESCKTIPEKHVAGTVEAEAKVTVNPPSATTAVNNATPEERAALQHSVEPVSDAVSKSPTQSVDTHVKDPVGGISAVAGIEKKKDPLQVKAEVKPEKPPTVTEADVKSAAPAAKESCKTSSPKQVVAEMVEAEAKVAVKSSPETSAVSNTTPIDKPALQPVPDTVSKSPTKSDDAHVKDPVGGISAVAGTEKKKDPPQVTAEVKPEKPPTVTEADVKSAAPAAKESCKTSSPKQVLAEMAEAEAKVAVKSSPETSAVSNTTPIDKPALQPVPDTVSKSPTKSDDAHVKDPVGGISAVAGTEKKKDPPQVTDEVKPEKPPTVTEADVKSAAPAAKESCKTSSPKQVLAEMAEAEAKVAVKLSPETSAVSNTTPIDKPALQPVPDTVSKSPTKSDDAHVKDPVGGISAVAGTEKKKDPPQVTDEVRPEKPPTVTEADVKSAAPAAKESCKTSSPKQVLAEMAEAEAKVAVKSSPETSAVINATPIDKPALQPVPDTVSKSPTKSDDAHVKDPVGEMSAVDGTEKKKDPPQVTAEVKPEKPPTVFEPANAASLDHGEVKSAAPPAKDSCKTSSPIQVGAKTITTEAKVVAKSSPDTPAENIPTTKEKPVLQPVPDTISKLPTQSAADAAIKSAESEGKRGATAEPLENPTCETQPGNTTVEQSMGPASVNGASHVTELSSKEAVHPVTASEGGAAQDHFSDRAIELTDALDEAPATAESAPKPVNDPKQSQSEGSKPNQPGDTNSMEQIPREKPQPTFPQRNTRNGEGVCSFCDHVIHGNVKITVSDPPMTCHSECLKCGVCHKSLGDLMTPMFLHEQVIHCKACFINAL